VDELTRAQLESLRKAAAHAVERCDSRDAEATYESLRSRAARLNHAHGWAESEQFGAMFPTAADRRQIATLETLIGDPPTEDASADTRKLLRALGAWTTGLLAGASFPHEHPTRE
jgi:hypothetical protein